MKNYTLDEINESIDHSSKLHPDHFLLPIETSPADNDIMLFVRQKLFQSDQYGYTRGLDRYFSTLNI